MTHPETLTVDVTAKDVTEGIPRHTDRCPVARAARRVLEKHQVYDKVYVFPMQNPDEFFIRVHRPNGDPIDYLIPDDASLWISNFDASDPVTPMHFTSTGCINIGPDGMTGGTYRAYSQSFRFA